MMLFAIVFVHIMAGLLIRFETYKYLRFSVDDKIKAAENVPSNITSHRRPLFNELGIYHRNFAMERVQNVKKRRVFGVLVALAVIDVLLGVFLGLQPEQKLVFFVGGAILLIAGSLIVAKSKILVLIALAVLIGFGVILDFLFTKIVLSHEYAYFILAGLVILVVFGLRLYSKKRN